MILQRAFAVLGLFAVIGLAAQAQEPKDGPPKSKRADTANVVPSAFRAQLVVDNRFLSKEKGKDERDPRDRTGKMHCLVCENGLSPVVAVFVRGDTAKLKDTDGLSKLIKGTDALIPKYRGDKLAAFVMFLKLDGGKKAVTVKGADESDTKVEVDLEYPHDEMRDEKVAEVKNYAAIVNADNVPFGLAADKSVAVTAFAIPETAAVTVIIYNRLRTAQRWELKMEDLTDEKVAEILNATEKMVRGAK